MNVVNKLAQQVQALTAMQTAAARQQGRACVNVPAVQDCESGDDDAPTPKAVLKAVDLPAASPRGARGANTKPVLPFVLDDGSMAALQAPTGDPVKMSRMKARKVLMTVLNVGGNSGVPPDDMAFCVKVAKQSGMDGLKSLCVAVGGQDKLKAADMAKWLLDQIADGSLVEQ